MWLFRFRASSGRCRCLLVAYLTAALDLTTARDVDVVMTSEGPLPEAACVDVSLRQNTTDAQPPAAKKPPPATKTAPKPKPAAKSPTPKPGVKSPTPKPGVKSPTPKPGAKPKAGPTVADLAALNKMSDFADARAAARVAHQFAKTAVKATRKFSKKYIAAGKGKGKAKKLKIKACDQSAIHRKVVDALKEAESDSMKKVLGKKKGCGKGMATSAAVEAARAVLEARVSGKVAGGQLTGRMGHMLAKTRELREQVAKMRVWLAKGKKSDKKVAKKIKNKKSIVIKKKSVVLAAKAATAATIKAVAGGLSRCKARRLAEKAAGEALAIHALLQTAKKKGKGKKCAKGKNR